ncbi:MAG: radical SAM protein [Candidatus Omnitrophota bacterium]
MKIVLVSLYLFKSISIRMLTAAIKKTPNQVFPIFFKEITPNSMPNPTDKEYLLFRNLIEELRPDLIGISVNSTFFKHAKELTKIVKSINENIFIVWGGIHPTVAPEHSLNCADAICIGEGIYPMLELIENLARADKANLEKIENIWIKKDNGEIIRNPVRNLESNLDNYPNPDWRDQNTFYIEKDCVYRNIPNDLIDKSYYIMSSFGCPFSCYFCCNDALKKLYSGKGPYVRRRSVGRVIEELKMAKTNFPDLKVIHIVDDVFTFDGAWLSEFIKLYRKGINIPFSCYSQPSLVKDEVIGMLSRAGLKSMTMGIQSGSERVREEVFNIKSYSNADIEAVSQYFKGKTVKPCYDLLLDNPFEVIEDKYKSLDLLLKFPRPFDLHQHSLTFFPGVELTQRAIKEGLIKNEFVECEEQKSMFRWTAELDITRKPQDLFWDILFFMTRYPGIPKFLIRKFSRSKLIFNRPKIIYPLAMVQKFFDRIKNPQQAVDSLNRILKGYYFRRIILQRKNRFSCG